MVVGLKLVKLQYEAALSGRLPGHWIKYRSKPFSVDFPQLALNNNKQLGLTVVDFPCIYESLKKEKISTETKRFFMGFHQMSHFALGGGLSDSY